MEPTDQPSSQPPVPVGPPVGTGGAVCYRHPARPTRLSCSSCGRPICVDCTNQASVGQKCPECAAPTGRNRVIRARDVSPSGMLDNAPVVTTILAITVGIAFLAMVAPAFWRGELFPLLADSTARVAQGDWWRTVSAALLHDTGLLHVGFNMWALAVFGPTIDRRAGSVPFLVMYLASAAAGGLLCQIVRDGDVAIGASGAIFGLFGAHLAAAFLARNTTAGRAGLRQLRGRSEAEAAVATGDDCRLAGHRWERCKRGPC